MVNYIYLQKGQEGIIKISTNYPGNKDMDCLSCFVKKMFICYGILYLYEENHGDQYCIKFDSKDSMQKFSENHFSNKGVYNKIEKLEKEISELKELIYFSVNGPGFREAKMDYEGQQEKIEKE